MRSDFELIVHQLPECPEAKVYFVGDLHVGAIEANIDGWEKFRDGVLKEPNTYICLMGDLMNNATKSSVSNVFDDALSKYPRPRDQKRYLANALEPLRSRILCAVSGNHEQRSGKDADDDPTLDIMSKLDLEDYYRPNAAFLKIGFGERDAGGGKSKPMQAYTLCCTHGAGGGIYTGAAVNRNERMAMFVNADILAVGHTHKGAITKPQRIEIDTYTNSVKLKSTTVISSCSWLSYGGYAMRKMLLPSSPQDPEQPQTLLLGANRTRRYIKVVW